MYEVQYIYKFIRVFLYLLIGRCLIGHASGGGSGGLEPDQQSNRGRYRQRPSALPREQCFPPANGDLRRADRENSRSVC